MVRFKYDNEHHNRLFLCFLIICMLVAGTAYETLDSEKLSYAGMNALNTISSPGNETFDIVVREHSGFSVIKNAACRQRKGLYWRQKFLQYSAEPHVFMLIFADCML